MLSKPTRTASPLDLIDSEIIQEQASALGRLGRGLEAALAALREFDAALARRRRTRRERSGQRWSPRPATPCGCSSSSAKSCGLRDSRAVMRDYAVPPEVQVRMGLLPPPPTPGKRRRGG